MKWLILVPAVVATATGQMRASEPAVEPESLLTKLTAVRRVFIDHFAGGESAAYLRDMIISSLQRSKLFVLTENPERADAVLRGSGEDLVFTDVFQTSEGIQARVGLNVSSGAGRYGRDARGLSAAIGDNESVRIAERKHEAVASVRLVGKDGDVLWATTQESQGAKFRGAGADVADKITRQLEQDMGRARAVPGLTLSRPPAVGLAP